jgi:hypothetical protein
LPEPLTLRAKIGAAVAAVVVIGFFAGVGVCAAMIDDIHFFSRPSGNVTAILGACIGGGLGFWLGQRLPGRPHKHWGLGIGLAIAGMFAGGFAPSAANVWLDREPAVIHETVIVARTEDEVRGRHGPRDVYFAELAPWAGMGSEPVRIRVPVSTIRVLRNGQTVRVHVRPGWLGHPWVERLEPGPLP